MKRLALLLSLLFMTCTIYSQSQNEPKDLTSNVTVTTDWTTVTGIENSFNTARRQEETQLGLCPNAIRDLDLPSQAVWDAYSIDQKALIILNDDRTARAGINYGNGPVDGFPFNGFETNIDNVAQAWSQYQIDNNTFGHCHNGSCPGGRIAAAYPSGCTESGGGIENIYAHSSGTINPVNAMLSAVFGWTYTDGPGWGHRRAMLSQGYDDDYGLALQEGFVGFGIAQTTDPAVTWKTVVTINFTNPVADANAGACGYNLNIPTNSVPGCLSAVTLTSPNGGETLTGGSTHNVTWNATSCFGSTNANILLSLDGGTTYPITLAANTVVADGTETVTIPAGIPNNTTTARIKIESSGTACASTSFFDASDVNFNINSNCLLTSSIICPVDSVSLPAGDAGLNMNLTQDYYGSPVTSIAINIDNTNPTGQLVNRQASGNVTCAQNWGVSGYQVFTFKVTQGGTYSFSYADATTMFSLFSGSGYDTANPCKNWLQANNWGGIGWGNGFSFTLSPCTTYHIVAWDAFNPDPLVSTINMSGPGVIYNTSGAPGMDYGYTYAAIDRTSNQIVATSSTSDFTALPAGDYLIHGAAYFTGTGTNPPPSSPSSWVNQTMAQILGTGNCVNFSGNSKALNISPSGGVLLSAKVFLQGPYSGALMNDQLRTAVPVLIPTTEPYTSINEFTHVNGGGETVAASVLNVTGNNAIVDWVFVELRSKSAPATVQHTRAALLQRDGDIVDVDGTSALTFSTTSPDDYYVAIRHRNHLGIRTNAVVALSGTTTTLDFTLASTITFGTNSRKDLGGGVLGMWGGNANYNTTVRATGPVLINDYSNLLAYLGTPTSVQTNVYQSHDFNMDGNVRATGPPTINDYSKLLNILGTSTTIINEQL